MKIFFLILVGSLTWSLTMFKSGLSYDSGLGFWGPNGHDGIWHIALAESLSRGSWQMPVFAGSALRNYHIGFDLLLALTNKLTKLPITILYFQIFPILVSLLVGFLINWFVYLWTKSKKASFWAIFFVYFSGSFGWLIGKGESAFWSQQAISTLINPPFALSLVLLLLSLIFLFKLDTKYKILYTLICILTFGSLIQIKAYASVLSLAALLIAAVYRILRDKKGDIFLIFLGSLVLSAILYWPLNKNSSSLLVIKPFWFLETMMGLTDRVGWLRFGEAMINWRLANNWLKAVPAYAIAFVIFWYGNMGLRVIGELYFVKKLMARKLLSFIEVFIASVIIGGVVLPMLFLQEGTPWNTIQFFYYSLFFSSILAGLSVGKIVQMSKTSLIYIIVVMSVVVLTLPTTINTLQSIYLPSRPPAMLPEAEQEALSFLSQQPDGVVLTYPFDKLAAKEAEASPPRPLYLYESTAYVSAFSKKSVLLEDEVNLNIMGYNWQERREEVEKFYKSLDQNFVRSFLRDNNISYIYWVKPQRATLGETQLGLERIFENKEVDIYKVKK